MTKLIRTVFDQLIVIGIILGVAYSVGLLTGFTKGNDVYAYLTKIRLIDTYFPHINWNPFWDSGTPFSIWSYPPLAMLSTTFIFVKLLGQSYGSALTIMATIAFCLLGIGIYGFITEVTGKRLAGLLAVVLFVSSPASWNWWAVGNYVRVFGMGFFGLSLWAISAYIKRFLNGQPARGWFLATIVFISLAVSSHLLIGGITMTVVFFMILFAVPTIEGKIRFWLKLGILPLLSAAYYYLPMYLTGHVSGRFIGINPGYPIPVSSWFGPVNAMEEYSLSTVLSLTFIASLTLTLIMVIFKRSLLSRFEKAVIFSFGLFILGNIAYNSVGFLPFYPETWYVVGFAPITAFALLSCAWAAGAGLFFGVVLPKLLKQTKLANLILLVLIILALVSLWRDADVIKKTVKDLTDYGTIQQLSQDVVRLPDPQDFNHRFGTDSGLVADWFTYKYDMPQTRDYFAQGIPYVNWQNWMETAIWAWNDNWNETRFLLDWYGIKYVFVTEPHYNHKKFLSNPDDFSVASTKTYTSPGTTLTQYMYLKAQPIVSLTNAPTMLVVGAPTEYDVLLRVLARAGFGSQKVIPIWMAQNIDSLSLSELKKFSVLVLYNYQYENAQKTEKLLNDYLLSGGKIFIDTFRGPNAEGGNLTNILPVTRTKKTDINGSWNFINLNNSFIEGVNLENFSPASYNGSPWHVSIASKTDLAKGAEAILENNQGILMAAKTIGRGEIVWSGLNFPFHVVDSKNSDELKLMQNILNLFNLDQIFSPQASTYQFINPEKRQIIPKEQAKGILFKETNFMDWHAPGKIYFAGPGFMYMFLDQGKNNYQSKPIVFDYRLSLVEIVSLLIAFSIWAYYIILLMESILKKPIISSKINGVLANKKNPFFSGATNWWDQEEE